VDKIRIKTNLLGDIEQYGLKNKVKPYLWVDLGLTLNNILKYFNIPKKKDKVILINGRRVDKDYILKEDDEITIFPMVDGG